MNSVSVFCKTASVSHKITNRLTNTGKKARDGGEMLSRKNLGLLFLEWTGRCPG